ncbi:MAG: LamG-like jellyroll fold domain-containing protein [Turneriella sp.]
MALNKVFLCLIASAFLLNCQKYDLLEKVENPGGKVNASGSSCSGGAGIVKDGLVAFWNLNGNTNDKWDCGTGFQPGTPNSFSYVTDRFGVAGNAINLTSGVGLVNFGNLNQFQLSPFTVCAWIRLTAAATTMPAVRKHDGTNGWRFQVRDVTSSADFGLQGTYYVSTGTGMTVGNWYYVCMVVDTSLNPSIIGYVGLFNSTMQSSQYNAIAGMTGNTSNLELNATGGTGGAVEFDDVAFYSRGLNSAEIQQNYTASEQ